MLTSFYSAQQKMTFSEEFDASQRPWFLASPYMIRPSFGANSPAHFPALAAGNIKGRVQSEAENTDLQILLEYTFVL